MKRNRRWRANLEAALVRGEAIIRGGGNMLHGEKRWHGGNRAPQA